MKKLIIFFSLFLFTACSSSEELAVFEFEELEYDFGLLKQSGGIVSHEFVFTYNGDIPIEITAVPASCACTEGEVDKIEYQPGEEGVLTVFFNPNLHAEPEGHFYKSVSLVTQPALDQMPEVKVWQEIDLDLGEEFFELQMPHDDEHEEHGVVYDL